MFTVKRCTYLTYHRFRPENDINSGPLICKMGDSLKSGVCGGGG